MVPVSFDVARLRAEVRVLQMIKLGSTFQVLATDTESSWPA